MEHEVTDHLHEELNELVGSLDVAPPLGTGDDRGGFRVERVLKESSSEVTQLVWFRAPGAGELGPFVRKVISGGMGMGSVYRLLAEGQRQGRRFRHLPQVYSCVSEPAPDGIDRLCVVMEYVSGATLREVIERACPEQREELATVLLPAVCEAVAELHESFDAPIVHRDLTPSNIMLPELDPARPVLIDFGIARSWHEDATADTTHFGTRAYAAPEQFGFGQTDVRSDVFALGLLAFFCLTGRDPEPRDRERGFDAPGVSEAWRTVIAKAAAFDPGQRYASVRELGEAFTEAARRLGAPELPSAPVDFAWGGEAPTSKPASFFIARNIVVLTVAAFFVAVSISCAFDPAYVGNGSVLVNLFGYLLFMPGNVLAIAYLLLDKRWLRENITAFQDQAPAQLRKPAFVAMGVLFGLFVALTVVATL